MNTVGLVALPLHEGLTRRTVASRTRSGLELVSEGRSFCAFWEVPYRWRPTTPIEGWITEAVLGSPTAREDCPGDFTFFANMAVRTYRDDPARPARTLHAVIFRRNGDLPYRRRLDSTAPLELDTLATLEPVFTRDVANNVWHLPDVDAESEMIARLSRLLCWSDEQVLVLKPRPEDASAGRRERRPDLIPVPVKVPYSWRGSGLQRTLFPV